MSRDPKHERLVGAFLALVAGHSDREAAALEGVPLTHERIRQLRADEWTRLNAETARALEGYVGGSAPEAEPLTEADEKRIAAKWMERMAQRLREEATEPTEREHAGADALREVVDPRTNERKRGL